MKILKYGGIVVATLLAASIGFMSCGNRGGTLASITVSPSGPTIARGTKHQFTAMATFSNGTLLDWTTAANWTSDNSAVTISNSFGSYGLATSLATGTNGTFTITATDTANHISGTATLTVVDPISITITPNAPFMAKNTTHQFKATATLALATGSTPTITQDLTSSPTLSWIVDNTTTTTTISSTGLVTSGTTTGTVTIKAFDIYSASTPTATTTLTVTDTPLESILVSAVTETIPQGAQQQFTAQGTFKNNPTPLDLTSSVTWHSSNTGVATISNEAGTYGLATALDTGATGTTTTTIRATDPITGISSPSTTLYVTP